MTLRPYQTELVNSVWAAFEVIARKVVMVLPTAGGKTRCFTHMISEEARSNRVWVIAHRQELIFQASETLTGYGISHGIVKAGHPFDPTQRVQVASIQTLVKRLDQLPAPDLIICDECHNSVSVSWTKVLDRYPNARILGATATPCRLDGRGLGEVYEHMVIGPTVRWLTEKGFLSPAEYYAPPVVANTDNLPKRGGDFAKEAAEEAMDKPTVTGDAVDHYRRICDGVPCLVFCTSVAHAKHVAEEYTQAGYRAASVDGSMSDEDRKDRISGLGTGKWQIITSCDLIGEGLDVPLVGAVQILRPTASLRLWLQMIGRGLRLHPLKSCTYILDHVGNVRRHGFATTVHEWTLAGRVKRKKDSVPSLRTCERCFLAHEPAPVCPMCSYVYPVKERTLTRIETVDGRLVKLEETKEERATALREARSLVELIAFAKSRGYSKPAFWARKVYFGRNHVRNLP